MFNNPIFTEFGQWVGANFFNLFVHAILFFSLAIFLKEISPSKLPFIMVLLAVLGILSGSGYPIADQVGLLNSTKLVVSGTLFLFLLSQDKIQRPFRIVVLLLSVLCLAFASLAKLNMMVLSVLTLILFVGVSLFYRKLKAAALGFVGIFVYGFFLLVIWEAFGQNSGDLIGYLDLGFKIASSYVEAMAADCPVQNLLIELFSLAVGILFFVFALKNRDKVGVYFCVLFSGLVFMAFRHGSVRQCHLSTSLHEFSAVIFFVIALVLILIGRVSSKGNLRGYLTTLLFVASLPLFVINLRSGIFDSFLFSRIENLKASFSLLVDSSERENWIKNEKQALAEIYSLEDEAVEFGRAGDIDVIPWDIVMAYAYDYRWTPRPVFQSYIAFTPELDEINRKYVQSENRPERILFGFKSIDNKYPFFDEPSTYRQLLWGYELAGRSKEYLFLKRSKPSDMTPHLYPLKTLNVKLGDKVEVPEFDGGLVFAKIYLDMSVLGKFMKMVYKPSLVHFVFLGVENGGAKFDRVFRLVREGAVNGVLVSEYLHGIDDLESLWKGEEGKGYDAFMIRPDQPSHFKKEYRIEFYGMEKSK